MFKRSFGTDGSKNRAGKATKPAKRSFREHARQKLPKADSPPLGRFIVPMNTPEEIATDASKYPHLSHHHADGREGAAAFCSPRGCFKLVAVLRGGM